MKAIGTILQRKTVVRNEINSVVNSLTDLEVRRQSEIVVRKVLEHPAYKSANTISIYLSYDKEINTSNILEDIFRTKKECFIPRFQKGIPEMEMVKLHSIDDYNKLPLNKWNIKQPSHDEARESIFAMGSLDLVIVPGLAFTDDGVRLGRGKGYYDRFLAKCTKEFKTRPYSLALAFNEQIIHDVPYSETDVKIDCVLFELQKCD